MLLRLRQSTLLIALCATALALSASAAERPAAADVWTINLGQSVADIPDSFADFACGTNGGPPSTALSGFNDFMRCPPEADGLREVYFRYDDELEFWAKANNFPDVVAASGTKVYGLPVIMSVLVDSDGIVQGLRLVSDPRDDSVERQDARFLGPFLLSRFRPKDGDWTCTDLPPAAGETPVNGEFVKQDCTLTAGGRSFSLSVRYLRGAGERQVDPHTGAFTQGQFQSEVRFQMRLSP